jgi:hypothetical protein
MSRFIISSIGKRHMALLAGGSALLAALGCTVTDGPIEDDGGGLSGGSTAVGPVEIYDLGSESVNSNGDTEVTVEVPAGAESFALVVEGAGSELVVASKVQTPSGEVVFDFNADISINRTDPTDGLYTLLVPTNPTVAVEEGDWLINLMSGGNTFDAQLTSIIKTKPAVDKMLDLNFYFVGLDGLDAATAETDAGFQAILSNVSGVYQGAGLSVRAITYTDVEAGAAGTYGVIDSDAELAEMFALSPSDPNVSLNLFLVNDIAIGGSGFSILGLAGGVPGPPVLQGTSRSGVAVNMGSYLAAVTSGDQMMIDSATAELEIIMAHESGHFLGLYHTVERNGVAIMGGQIQGEDPLADTNTCPDSADADMDGVLSPTECAGQGADNLMFWSPANDARTLTANQGAIMLANPLIH